MNGASSIDRTDTYPKDKVMITEAATFGYHTEFHPGQK
jgi:hypothetical protein